LTFPRDPGIHAEVIGLLGIVVILGIAWALSIDRRRALNPRIIAWGLGLPILMAVVTLRTPLGARFFMTANDTADAFIAFANKGISFVFGEWTEQARETAREKRLQPGIGLEQRIYDSYHSYFELVVADPEMFEVLRRNADAIAMMGSEDLFAEAVREFVEDMQQWVQEGQLPADVEQWLPYVARSLAGGAFQIAAHMADEGASDVDATARFCAGLMLDGLRGIS